MEIPTFNSKSELFAFLVKNKDVLMAQKKAEMKHADPIIYAPVIIRNKEGAEKDMPISGMMPNDCLVKIVINTTNIMDNHKDVHLPGLWTKSLKENKMIMHLQEHEMCFENIISDGKDLKAYTQTMSWNDLGFNLPGNTEALIFESLIRADRNPFMADQYIKGYVKNHSVGMNYVKVTMCINDENYGAEYEAWQKYYPEVANKEMADEYGYFWAIKEAKIIEGSAVPRGSNWATPTISVSEQKNQPLNGTGVTCKNCNYKFDYNSIPESGMGYVLCPNCKEAVTQAKIEPSQTLKKIDYNYLLTHLKV